MENACRANRNEQLNLDRPLRRGAGLPSPAGPCWRSGLRADPRRFYDRARRGGTPRRPSAAPAGSRPRKSDLGRRQLSVFVLFRPSLNHQGCAEFNCRRAATGRASPTISAYTRRTCGPGEPEVVSAVAWDCRVRQRMFRGTTAYGVRPVSPGRPGPPPGAPEACLGFARSVPIAGSANQRQPMLLRESLGGEVLCATPSVNGLRAQHAEALDARAVDPRSLKAHHSAYFRRPKTRGPDACARRSSGRLANLTAVNIKS